MYGGTHGQPYCPGQVPGLSPRVRGNPPCCGRELSNRGSIPACTGEPRRRLFGDPTDPGGSIPACTGEPGRPEPHLRPVTVYPRVYGGTRFAERGPAEGQGLSPRVRGNHFLHIGIRAAQGSIPACTGEPPRSAGVLSAGKVYPRVYGGTLRTEAGRDRRGGLSPRVRGNLRMRQLTLNDARSIPACTGEPAGGLGFAQVGEVYPRVYGGTVWWG